MTPKKENEPNVCALHDVVVGRLQKEMDDYRVDIKDVFGKLDHLVEVLDKKFASKMSWKAFGAYAGIILLSVATIVGLVENHSLSANREMKKEFLSAVQDLRKEVMESQAKQDAILADCDQARREWNRVKAKPKNPDVE